MRETGFTYLINMLVKVEVFIKDNIQIKNSVWWECITAKQFNWKMADDHMSLLFSANNNKVSFMWIKF